MPLIDNFLSALFLTIMVELAVAFFFGFKRRTDIITIVCINSITNPILNYLLLVNYYFSLLKPALALTLFLEILVVFAEWKLLAYTMQEKPSKLLTLSFAMNFCSYIAGILILK